MSAAVLTAWLGDNTRYEGDIEILNLGLLGLGALAVLAGSTLLCVKARAEQLMLMGAVTAGIALGVLPLAGRVTGFEINVHDWSGVLFAPSLLLDVLGLIFLLVGFLRFVFKRLARR